MKDRMGREIDYMRFSITDRCNLHCKYCMPDGIDCMPRWDVLSLEEFEAIAIAAASLGIKKIKVTGGEPLARKNCPQLVKMLKTVPGIEKVTLTTNGVQLDQYMDQLLNAGLDAVNISLDTVDPVLYEKITGRDKLAEVLKVIEKAESLPIPVKINAVSIDFRQLQADEKATELSPQENWQQVAELAKRYPVDVRFIEMMPIGYGKQFKTIDHNWLLENMKKMYPDLAEDTTVHGFGPAVYYKVPGFKGSIGLISAIHGKFCSTCNRVRLTSQGHVKSCLCYDDGTDLRSILREGQERPAQDTHYIWPKDKDVRDEKLQTKLREALAKAIYEKPAAHCFEKPGEITEAHNMISIGG